MESENEKVYQQAYIQIIILPCNVFVRSTINGHVYR